jgi:hypothetical protein
MLELIAMRNPVALYEPKIDSSPAAKPTRIASLSLSSISKI